MTLVTNALTILLPVKNGEQYIQNSLDCIVANVKIDDEILIVNDGSIDNTEHILKSWARKDPRIKIINNHGRGLVNALNLGLKESSNNWIARFDVDDLYPNYRLQNQRPMIEKDVAAIFCDYSLWSSKIRNVGVIPSAVLSQAVSLSLINSQRTPHPGVLFNKEAVLSVGGYRKEDFPAEDLSLWMRLSKIGKLISVPETLLNYRISKTSVTGLRRREALMKKQDLLKNIQLNFEDIDWCLNHSNELLKYYSSMSCGPERQILFIKELRKATEVYNIKSDRLRDIEFAMFKNFAALMGATKLVKTKCKKKLAHKIN